MEEFIEANEEISKKILGESLKEFQEWESWKESHEKSLTLFKEEFCRILRRNLLKNQ